MDGGCGGNGMKSIGDSSRYVKTSFGISVMKKSRPVILRQLAVRPAFAQFAAPMMRHSISSSRMTSTPVASRILS